MQCFPQLVTGAMGQYPIRRRTSCRTIRNVCADGREIKLADPAASSTEWTLTFSELVDDEIKTLRDFFVRMEGTLSTFTFLDPTDNLLAWSEKLDDAVWQKDAMLQVAGGVADPFGNTSAWNLGNETVAPRKLAQTLKAPANYYYSLSLWVRSQRIGEATLFRGAEKRCCPISPDWQRIVLSSDSRDDGEMVAFGIEVGPESSIDIFGVQAEAQIGASNYKRTASNAGVHPMTRFSDDGFTLTTIGPSRHGCLIHLQTN